VRWATNNWPALANQVWKVSVRDAGGVVAVGDEAGALVEAGRAEPDGEG
jgi:hypothetical protein